MSANKDYTVVGFYNKRKKPFVVHTQASDPEMATVLVLQDQSIQGRQMVVEVFEGHQHGVLGNDRLMTPDNVVLKAGSANRVPTKSEEDVAMVIYSARLRLGNDEALREKFRKSLNDNRHIAMSSMIAARAAIAIIKRENA